MMTGYRRLPFAELLPGDLARRRRRLSLSRGTAGLFGRTIPLRLLLARALQRCAQEWIGFAVPTSYATTCFVEVLQFDCNPARLELQLADWVGCETQRWHLSDHFLGAGDWSPLVTASDVSPVMCEARELQACDLDYRATAAYAAMLQTAAQGRPVRRQHQVLATPNAIDLYFERFVALFETIAKDGVLPHRRLRELGLGEPGERDVGVAIGAEGELYRLPGGQHRTAIARVLGLPRMPVEVRLVHANWLRRIMMQHQCSVLEAVPRGIALLQSRAG